FLIHYPDRVGNVGNTAPQGGLAATMADFVFPVVSDFLMPRDGFQVAAVRSLPDDALQNGDHFGIGAGRGILRKDRINLHLISPHGAIDEPHAIGDFYRLRLGLEQALPFADLADRVVTDFTMATDGLHLRTKRALADYVVHHGRYLLARASWQTMSDNAEAHVILDK